MCMNTLKLSQYIDRQTGRRINRRAAERTTYTKQQRNYILQLHVSHFRPLIEHTQSSSLHLCMCKSEAKNYYQCVASSLLHQARFSFNKEQSAEGCAVVDNDNLSNSHSTFAILSPTNSLYVCYISFFFTRSSSSLYIASTCM